MRGPNAREACHPEPVSHPLDHGSGPQAWKPLSLLLQLASPRPALRAGAVQRGWEGKASMSMNMFTLLERGRMEGDRK